MGQTEEEDSLRPVSGTEKYVVRGNVSVSSHRSQVVTHRLFEGLSFETRIINNKISTYF